MLKDITPVILTYNEAPNIERTLSRLDWAKDILVVDSFSQDETVSIANERNQARIVQREFDSFAGQCNYALAECEISTEWVLNLDADYILTDELIGELAELKANPNIAGYRARFVYCINGRRLRSGIYPPVTVLFRKSSAKFVDDGHAHRVVVDGNVVDLHSPILHDDRKSLRRWFQSQVAYTALEAHKLQTTRKDDLSWADRIRRWRFVAPLVIPFYCLIFRGGILDGWPGLFYAFQRTVAELMLSLYLFEDSVGAALRGRSSFDEVPIDSAQELAAERRIVFDEVHIESTQGAATEGRPYNS